MQIIRPDKPGKIFLPRETDGSLQATVFEVAHQDAGATIFWYLDETFAGQTSTFHTLSLQPAPGKHILTLLDGEGNLLRVPFEIVGKQR
jgi:penicillin-binding protein 1C